MKQNIYPLSWKFKCAMKLFYHISITTGLTLALSSCRGAFAFIQPSIQKLPIHPSTTVPNDIQAWRDIVHMASKINLHDHACRFKNNIKTLCFIPEYWLFFILFNDILRCRYYYTQRQNSFTTPIRAEISILHKKTFQKNCTSHKKTKKFNIDPTLFFTNMKYHGSQHERMMHRLCGKISNDSIPSPTDLDSIIFRPNMSRPFFNRNKANK